MHFELDIKHTFDRFTYAGLELSMEPLELFVDVSS